MRIKKFRVKNYKSIIDSGDCYLTDTITILAGKNESGKTSLLEALEDFDVEKNISEEARPIGSPKKNPKISITFTLEEDTVKEILEEIASPVSKVHSDIELEIIKTFPNLYSFEKSSLKSDIFGSRDIQKAQKSVKSKWNKVKSTVMRTRNESLKKRLFKFDFSDFARAKEQFMSFIDVAIDDIPNFDDEVRDNLPQLLSEIDDEINNLEGLLTTKEDILEVLKQKYIPNFILFSSFEDIIPNKISFTELEENEWVKDLSVISDLSIDTIRGTDDRVKANHRESVNIKLHKDYKQFWTQDASNLSINWDSEYLYLWVKEGSDHYEPSLRSKGRQWHLAFYIKVSARANENVPNTILIDEPGLFLHAKAQEDILKKLEDSAKEVQLIFSTHSPYLLEADKLNRVRLIHRTGEAGTKISKVHASADKETLTPILTAIGLGLNAGIIGIPKVNNVVVEGISDVYYLNAFKRLLAKDGVNFISGGGAGNMPFVGTILHGWGAKVVYLYDNDQGKKDGEKNLKGNWLIQKDLILSILGTKGTIEDIFSSSDFREFVLGNTNENYTGSNSQYVNENALDKVLLAKNFLETCQDGNSINLTESTMGKIVKLLGEIESKF